MGNKALNEGTKTNALTYLSLPTLYMLCALLTTCDQILENQTKLHIS